MESKTQLYLFSQIYAFFNCNKQNQEKLERTKEMADGITENLLGNAAEESAGEIKQSSAHRVWNESKKIWVVAAPAMFCRFTTFGTGIITQAFVGHVGSKELAAFALVFTVFIRFAQGVLVIAQTLPSLSLSL